MKKITVTMNNKKGDGSKSTKVAVKPSFADKIKPLTKEQIDKGNKINELDKKKKLFGDGTKKIGTKKKSDTYTREVTKTEMVTPGSKGKLYIKEGTVQRKNPKGVEFVPKEKESNISNSSGKIVDPKSRKVESDKQASLRKAALDSDRNTDLSKKYKEGDTVTYPTKKGPQVAGKIEKEKDTPPTYKTSTVKQVQVSKKGGVVSRLEGTKEQQAAKAKELKAQGYNKQAGTSSYIKDDSSKWVDEDKAAETEKEGYYRSDRAKKKVLEQKAKGTKKIKFSKGKMC